MSRPMRARPGWTAFCATALLLCGSAASLLCTGAAAARTLDAVRASGAIKLCAHPNSLPYASKAGSPAGFQIELGQALATRLGVSLDTEWIVTPSQISRADCDILLDTIADQESQSETHLALSKPYYGSGVDIVVRQGSPITGIAALNGHTKVGVMVGSVAAMMLEQRGVTISMFGFEEDMLAALAASEIDAAAATPMAAGWFHKTHASDAPITIMPTSEPALNWNVAVGMRRPDDKLREAINDAVATLGGDGTIAAIYARYGITLQAPHPAP